MRRTRRTLAAFVVVFSLFLPSHILFTNPSDPPDHLPSISSGQAKTPRHYQDHLLRFSSRDSIGFNVWVSGVDIDPKVEDGETYHELAIEGATPYDEEGAPAVPVIRKLVAIPECDDITISVRVGATSVSDDVNVSPAPRFVPSESDPGHYNREFVKNDSIYSWDADFPGEFARIEEIGYLRGQHLAWVHVYPVQFNPVKRQMTVATDLVITLVPENPAGDVSYNVGPMTNVLRRLALNYDLWSGPSPTPGMGGGPATTSADGSVYLCGTTSNNWRLAADSINAIGEPDYLIIMADELADSLVWDLAMHRAAYNGFNVAIAKMSQIHSSPNITSTPDSIRLFVKDIFDAESAAHMADSQLAYVLLMGDAYNPDFDILIPSSYECGGGTILENDKASDAHYTFLNSTPCSDPFPDLYIGRIPADRDSFAADMVHWELSNVVRKILVYEPLPISSWVDSILLVSGGSDYGFSWWGEGASGFDDFFDNIITSIIPSDQSLLKKHRLSEPGTSHENYSDALNALVDTTGFRIIGLFDHGFIPGLANTWFPLHYDTIRNDHAFPLVFSIASYTGCFDLDDSLLSVMPGDPCVFEQSYSGIPCQPGSPYLDDYDVFAERMLLQPNGAIGVISYSRSNGTDEAERDFPNLFRAVFEHNAGTLGEIIFEARLVANSDISLRNLQLLGDPAVNIIWQDVESDSVDLAVGTSDIRVGNGVKRYAGTANLEINVTVSNRWREAAYSVKVALLDDHPDSAGVALLDTVRLDSVPAFGAAVATLDAGSFNEGPLELFVHVDPDSEFAEPATSNNVAGATFDLLPYLSGFPKALSRHCSKPLVLADLNTDPFNPGKEILLRSDSLLCISSSGNRIWGNSGAVPGKAAVANVCADLAYRILTGFGGGSPSSVWVQIRPGADGSAEDAIELAGDGLGPALASGQMNQALSAADIVPLDSLEIVAFVASGATHCIKVVSVTGTELWSVPLGNQYVRHSSVGVGDIDTDGGVEIVCAFGGLGASDSVVVIDDNARKWAAPLGNSSAEIAVALADLDDDADADIIVNGGYTYADSSVLFALDPAAGAQLWRVELSASPPRFSIGDLDYDGTYEVVVHAGDSLLVLDNEGGREYGRSLGGIEASMSQPLLVDLDNDGALEIVVLGEIIDSATGARTLSLQIYDSNLDSVGVWHEFWHKYSSFPIIAHPAVDDIDGNGVYDLVFASADSVLHAFEIGTSAGRRDWGEQFQNPMQSNLVAQPVAGTYSNPVSFFNRVRLTADAKFDSTLYFDAMTSEVTVVSTDTLIEMRVNDDFNMTGLSSRPLRFYSTPTSTDSATWGGILIDGDGTADSLVYFSISDADIGIENRSELLIRDGEVVKPYTVGIYALDDIAIRNTTVTQSGGLGLYLGSGVLADIDDSVFDYSASSGVKCDTCSTSSTITGSSASNNGLYGIHLQSSSMGIASCVITNNDYVGIGCIESNSTIDASTLDDNGAGIYCDAGSNPTIAYSTIGGSTNGVLAWNDSYPDLGGGDDSDGHNCFGRNTLHISTLSDPVDTLFALYNYWGDPELCCPSKKLIGNIYCDFCDTSPQCEGPQGMAPVEPPKPSRLPTTFALRHPIPNPFNPVTTVRYEIPPPGSEVLIIVYNVRGQRVADLVSEYK